MSEEIKNGNVKTIEVIGIRFKESGKTWMGSPAIPYREYLRAYAVFRKAGK